MKAFSLYKNEFIFLYEIQCTKMKNLLEKNMSGIFHVIIFCTELQRIANIYVLCVMFDEPTIEVLMKLKCLNFSDSTNAE